MIELVNADGESGRLTAEQMSCWHDWRVVVDKKYLVMLECVLCECGRIERRK